ncbi:HAD family hydrolase [Chloroflexota bacterium]
MKYKAVIFDLDGTLLDTLQDIADSANQALSHLGFPTHELEAYKYFIGDGREVLAIRALPEHHRDATTVSKLVVRINEEYSKRWAGNTFPYPGIMNLLDYLTVNNIRMAVLSNKAHDLTEMMVSNILFQWHFDTVVGASAITPKKPDPTAALQIAKRLGVYPYEVIYLGDSDVDMETANKAGMHAIGVLWGFRSAEELLSGGAKSLIEHPNDLPPFLLK